MRKGFKFEMLIKLHIFKIYILIISLFLPFNSGITGSNSLIPSVVPTSSKLLRPQYQGPKVSTNLYIDLLIEYGTRINYVLWHLWL